MGELNTGYGAMRFEERRNPRQTFDVRIAPDAEILRTDPAARFDGGRLEHDERGSADGAAAEVYEMPVGRKTVHRAVLAHR